MRKTSALACVAFSALTILGNVPTVRAATPIQCGDVITGNVVLTEDLTCSGDALRVAGPGEVNIDLNGHRLRGDGTGNGIGIAFAPGIERPSRITVTGGRIEGFSAGVRNAYIPARIHLVTLADNTRGLTTDAQITEVEISESTFLRNDVGLARYTWHTTVTGSSFRDNGVGINCRDGNLWVVDSRFSDNERGIDSSLCRVDVRTSEFVGGEIGLVLERSEKFRMDIRNNTFKGAGIGVYVTRAEGWQGYRVIADNAFVDNGASGLVIDNGPRASGQGFEVSGNVFKGNGYLPGSHVDPTGSPLTSGVWSDTGSMFVGNTAIGNAGHGIEANGATDGGGNIARGNAAQPQCIGVVCARAR